MAPLWLYRVLRRRNPLPGPRQSLGFLPKTLRSDGRPTIWFHSCSVGETLSVGPLAHELHERFPDARLVFSTITDTGQAIARQRFGKYGEGNSFYFPFDVPPIVRRVFDEIRPTMLVIVDVEIWPNVVHEANRRGIPVAMCNGRIPAGDFRRYRLVRRFLGRVLGGYSLLMMKSQEDAERILVLGAPPEKVVVTGNVKCDRDVVERELRKVQTGALERSLGLEDDAAPLIVAGCTHPPEEAIVLDVFRRLRQEPNLGNVRLLLAPRHPERFDEVAELARKKGFTVRRRTDQAAPDGKAEVLLLDSIGELSTAYRFATVAFVGGTLVPHGGQSVLEPACYARPIVIGPSMESFPQIVDDFRAGQALVQIPATSARRDLQVEQLVEALGGLLKSREARESLGRRAAAVLDASRGAAALTAERLASLYVATRRAATASPTRE